MSTIITIFWFAVTFMCGFALRSLLARSVITAAYNLGLKNGSEATIAYVNQQLQEQTATEPKASVGFEVKMSKENN